MSTVKNNSNNDFCKVTNDNILEEIDLERDDFLNPVGGIIEGQKHFLKKNMNKDNLLCTNQTKDYVLYYIFHKERPVYVGITNNFMRRRSEHFSEAFRCGERGKKLYMHMENNSIEEYEMYIVLQTNSAQEIEDVEAFHIKHLRSLYLAENNSSSGGGYAKAIEKVATTSLKEFFDNFCDIEESAITCHMGIEYEVDYELLEKGLKNIDWSLLYSVEQCWCLNFVDSYEDYIRKNEMRRSEKSKEHVTPEEYESYAYNLASELSPSDLFWEIMSGNPISDRAKESSLNNFIDLIKHLENSNDFIEVFVGLNCLLGGNYEEEILPIIGESLSKYEYYELEKYIHRTESSQYGDVYDTDYAYEILQ